MTISETPRLSDLSKMKAAKIAIGTTPTPKKMTPIRKPIQPNDTKVTVAPRVQVVIPKSHDAINKPMPA